MIYHFSLFYCGAHRLGSHTTMWAQKIKILDIGDPFSSPLSMIHRPYTKPQKNVAFFPVRQCKIIITMLTKCFVYTERKKRISCCLRNFPRKGKLDIWALHLERQIFMIWFTRNWTALKNYSKKTLRSLTRNLSFRK